MSKKKLNSLEDLGGFVFSTDTNFEFDQGGEAESIDPKNQFLEALFSNKGRGGKTVTLIRGFEGPSDELKALGKMLKTKCGVGGSVKDGDIIIQGKHRDKIMTILKENGYNVKRVGG